MTQQASTPDALIERLRARTAGPKCNADGTYTVGNCPPDALCREAAAEIERLTGINSDLCRKTNALTIQSARDAEEIERLRDELNLCCALKLEYQQQAAGGIERQHAEIELLRADAARYRWLRDENTDLDKLAADNWGDGCQVYSGAELDSAIDAAMRDATNVRIEAPPTG